MLVGWHFLLCVTALANSAGLLQVVSLQASCIQNPSEISTLQHGAKNQHHDRDTIHQQLTSHQEHRPPAPNNMFRFHGQFAVPNNPDMLEQDQQHGVYRATANQQAVQQTRTTGVALSERNRSSSGVVSAADTPIAADAERRPVVAADIGAEGSILPTTDSLPQQHMSIAAGTRQGSPLAKPDALSRQHPQSEFRRSHSPEWYDAKFKRYVLR